MTTANLLTALGLNPFYFRAGLLPHEGRITNQGGSLNPFYFRAGLLRVTAASSRRGIVLIPFISGLDCYPIRLSPFLIPSRLNPFYFRAGLLPDPGRSYGLEEWS